MSSLQHAPLYPPDLPTSFDALVLPVDKPGGWTSFDVVRKLRRLLGVRKIGHAGTLDPMATGVLICLVGRATRQMRHYMEQPKRYVGTFRLGQSTASYDADTPVAEERPWEDITGEDMEQARARFIGSISQRAPMFSAVKIEGERLYRKARRGEVVARPPRQVDVYEFSILAQRGPDVDFALRCSRGTYVRSIAHDFGEMLGCGAHLISLRRTAIGEVEVGRAWTIQALTAASSKVGTGGPQ